MKTTLELKIKLLQEEIRGLESQIDEIDSSIESNTFESQEIAEEAIHKRLRGVASDACEGSHSYGEDEYKQLFSVDGVIYEATVLVEYNRHDKTYYYVDDSEYSFKKVEAA